MKKRLSARQEKFLLNYIESGNLTQSYLNAGYNPRTNAAARSSASALFARDDVKARYKEMLQEIAKEKVISIEEIQAFWVDTMHSKAKDVKVADKLKASELLAKSLGMFIDRAETTITNFETNPFSNFSREELVVMYKNIIKK